MTKWFVPLNVTLALSTF